LLFCAVSNVLPAPSLRNVYLSMSSPVNVAIAMLAPPPLAATLVAVASISEWEIKRETTVSHALFNRAQLGLSTALASVVFGLGDRLVPSPLIIVVGVVAYHGANWLLVAAAEWSCRHTSPGPVLRGLLPSGSAALTYVMLGFAGVALALTFSRVGGWAVALLLLPLLGARQAVAVSRRLEESERAGRELADRVIDERERERTRIASDIHDVVLQDLAALQLQADNLVHAAQEGRVDLAARISELVRTSTALAIGDLRASIATLRRPTVDEAGLGATLERYARLFAHQSGIDTAVDVSAEVATLPASVAILLYECAQEALTNVGRHANASTAHVALRVDPAAAELRVVDDGLGIDDETSPRPADGSGLVLMREKVAMSGGGVWVSRTDDGGTQVTVRVPVARRG
jgi:signal transduction histidine kinase